MVGTKGNMQQALDTVCRSEVLQAKNTLSQPSQKVAIKKLQGGHLTFHEPIWTNQTRPKTAERLMSSTIGAGEAQCNFHVTHLPSGESWAVRRRLTEWLHLEERMSLESGKLVARPIVHAAGPTLQGRRSSGLAALFVSRTTETRRQMDRLQARLSEMLCDDSLKASAALQDFLGLQAPEMPSSVRIVKLLVPWEDDVNEVAPGIESAEVHVEVSTHGMDSDAAYAMPTHVVASVLCLQPPAGDSQLREIVVPANSPATLVIDGLQPSSMYEFQVRATNSLGQSPSVCIRVLVPPRPEPKASKDSKMDDWEGALSLPETHSAPLAVQPAAQPALECSSADQRISTQGVDASAVDADVTGNGAAESSASSMVPPAEDQSALSLPETHLAPLAAEVAPAPALETSTVAEPRVDSALGSVVDSSADQRVTEGVDASAVDADVTGNGAAESSASSMVPPAEDQSALSLPETHLAPLAAELAPAPALETSTVAEPRVDSALGSVVDSSADQRVTEGVDASAVDADVTGNGAVESSASSMVPPAEDQSVR
ncbi:unnamed protein product [Cladocopium goreaui]|uniref:Fibronectin type-III domain-containing protein n=1 Tax=Cladocopium goreaui TaxID=2562237 RepID=A0A9P1GPF1_9DINO|nr:unnamed protein product [Cladocopium goreaui]